MIRGAGAGWGADCPPCAACPCPTRAPTRAGYLPARTRSYPAPLRHQPGTRRRCSGSARKCHVGPRNARFGAPRTTRRSGAWHPPGADPLVPACTRTLRGTVWGTVWGADCPTRAGYLPARTRSYPAPSRNQTGTLRRGRSSVVKCRGGRRRARWSAADCVRRRCLAPTGCRPARTRLYPHAARHGSGARFGGHRPADGEAAGLAN